MPFIIADRVRETSTTVGTGSIALAGAVTGYQTFDAVLDTGDTTYYTVADQGGNNWEVGIGTFTAPSTLARTTILSSSNGGSIVTFGAGIKDVFISLPASKTNVEDQPNLIEVNSSSPALRITQTGTGNALLVEDSANPDSTPFVVTADGNVGIGTTAPSATLNIYNATSSQILTQGDATANIIVNRASSDTGRPGLVIRKSRGTVASPAAVNSGDPLGTIFFQGFGGTNIRSLSQIWGNVETYTSDTDISSNITFLTSPSGSASGVEVMRITSGGNVGIGTSSPGARLDVSSGGNNIVASRSTGGYAAFQRFAPTGQQTYDFYNVNNVEVARITADASNFLSFSTGSSGTERMRIDASGNVGIGTSAPSYKLQTNAGSVGTSISNRADALSLVTTTSNVDLLNFYKVRDGSGSSWETAAWRIQQRIDVTDMGYIQFNGSGLPQGLAFGTSNTERMRIDSSGNVGIGTSSPFARLHVVGTIQAVNGSSAAQIYSDGGAAYFASSGAFPSLFLTNGAERMRIDASGNVGIGTSSPGAKFAVYTSNTDSINGILVAGGATNKTVMLRPSMGAGNNNGIVQAGDGGIIFDGGTFDTGAFVIAPWANATSGIRIVGSTGNVGIGTSSPGTRLTVAAAGESGARFLGNGLTSAGLFVGYNSAAYVFNDSNTPLIFGTNAAERMRITSDGNVGIGTNPGVRLNVLAADGVTNSRFAGASFAVRIVSAPSVGAVIEATNNNEATYQPLLVGGSQVQFTTFGTERARITAAGNVGIGTTSPDTSLGVNGGIRARGGAPGAFGANNNGYSFSGGGGDTDGGMFSSADGQVEFYTNAVERARITSGGGFRIGTSNNATSNGKVPRLYVYETAAQPPIATYVDSTSAANQIAFFNPNGEVGTINTDGFTTGYNTSSDYRLKHDVQSLTGALATIAALKPSTYKWNADDSHGEGFIAHELAEHIPLAVTGEKDAVNEDGSIKPQGVDYSKVVVHLVAAVQELTAKLEAAEARIATMETR